VPVRSPWKALAVGGAVLGGIGILALATRHKMGVIMQPKRVALIGDSYAVGLGPELEKLLPGLRGEGHVGTNSSQWASHSAACGQCGDWLTAFKPDVVLVSLGVNDGATPNKANYQTIVSSLHGIGAKVIWIEPPAAVNTPSRAIIRSLGVPTVPGTTVPMASDGLHPASYGPWSQEVASRLA
jgi:hypothetical protein